jgi:hypothetical protein
MDPRTPPQFGKRGLNVGRPSAPIPPPPPIAPRRLRSQTVVIGAFGALLLGEVAYAAWQHEQCRRPAAPPDAKADWQDASPQRPAWCDRPTSFSYNSNSWGSGTGHGFYLGGGSYGGGASYAGGAESGHASFGGFGGFGAGRGSGT